MESARAFACVNRLGLAFFFLKMQSGSVSSTSCSTARWSRLERPRCCPTPRSWACSPSCWHRTRSTSQTVPWRCSWLFARGWLLASGACAFGLAKGVCVYARNTFRLGVTVKGLLCPLYASCRPVESGQARGIAFRRRVLEAVAPKIDSPSLLALNATRLLNAVLPLVFCTRYLTYLVEVLTFFFSLSPCVKILV